MCGIAGLLRQDDGPVTEDRLRRMAEVLAHRGPDGEGFFIDGPVGLGHRRLSIIDLDTGAQPMGSVDGSCWITYNGEVYNYLELREELVALGHRFRTTSDTEVVLVAYQAWGPECLSRLRGMFAFAIWDSRQRRLFMARDRLGIKPLVYAWDGQCLRFASELKGLLADPEVPRDLDRDALAEYFTYLCIPSPRTIFHGIKKVPPASYLLCSADGGAPRIVRYWDIRLTADPGPGEAEWVESLRHVLDDSVKRHLISDVPVGAFLSGGLDSSTVVACMARVSSGRVKTFSIGFDESDYDELAYARRVAVRYGTEHFEMVVKPDVMDVLPRLAWQFDEPFADASAVPTYCVAKLTRDHVTVALSGDGGDESFAGYRRYADALRLHHRMDATPLAALKPALRWLGATRARGAFAKEFLEMLGSRPLERYHRMMAAQRPDTLAVLLSPEAAPSQEARTDYSAFSTLAAGAGTQDYLSTLQYLDVHHYLPEDILTKVDRASMLTSLEARVPLLDHVLMEHVAAMPPGLKLRDGTAKYILKQAMREHLPGEILTRRKMGFGVPLATWFRKDLREFTRDVLSDPRTRQRGIVRAGAAQALFESHLGGRRDHSGALWSLVCFELWCRTWWDR
jgi:asparagine synthase (glutamine-hydrolysing)